MKINKIQENIQVFIKIIENTCSLLDGQIMITQRLPLGSPGIIHKERVYLQLENVKFLNHLS